MSLFSSVFLFCHGHFFHGDVVSRIGGGFNKLSEVRDTLYLCFELFICLKFGYKLLCGLF